MRLILQFKGEQVRKDVDGRHRGSGERGHWDRGGRSDDGGDEGKPFEGFVQGLHAFRGD